MSAEPFCGPTHSLPLCSLRSNGNGLHDPDSSRQNCLSHQACQATDRNPFQFFLLNILFKSEFCIGERCCINSLNSDISYLFMKQSFKTPTTTTIMSCCLQDQISSKEIPIQISKQRPGVICSAHTCIYTCAPNH